jgi:hypothetical protein
MRQNLLSSGIAQTVTTSAILRTRRARISERPRDPCRMATVVESAAAPPSPLVTLPLGLQSVLKSA